MNKDLLKENITAARMTGHVMVYCLNKFVTTTGVRKQWLQSSLNWQVNVLPVVTSESTIVGRARQILKFMLETESSIPNHIHIGCILLQPHSSEI